MDKCAVFSSVSIPDNLRHDRSAVYITENRGEFLKPCPGTTAGYLCCGYQVLTPMTGCGMYCSYCILQTYFDHQCQVAYENFDDLDREVHRKLRRLTGVVRIGTGEFADSLFQEGALGFSRKVATVFEDIPRALVEFKTKSRNVDLLSDVKHPERIVIGFSMNTERMISVLERGTASLQQRLDAAARCETMGFRVAFHFDPMIWYDGCEQEYRDTVGRIFATIKDPETIAWCSMGAFRTMTPLKSLLRNRREHLPLFSGEMVTGSDGKYRYIRPIRLALYRAMDDEFRRRAPSTTLYLCMESPEIWNDAGMARRIPEGLVRYLDRRAGEILGIMNYEL
jgi:spore photoproduct lyase